MKVLITGGSGFIGTRLVEDLLNHNHEVTIFDKVVSKKYPRLTVQGDVRDKEALIRASEGQDIIYNLAAEHADDVLPKSLYADVNINGARHVVAAAIKNGITKIIFTSSVAIYGLNRGNPDESCDPKPFNEYGRTKYEAERIFAEWANECGQNSLTIVRPAVVFGENNRGNVYNLMNQIKTGKFLMIGNGHNKKSMGYVGNISAFLTSCMEFPDGIHVFNFADKPDLSSREIVNIISDGLNFKKSIPSVPYFVGILGGYSFDLIAKVLNRKFPVSSVRIKKFSAETTVNTQRLINSGFVPPYSLEEGLRKMIHKEFKIEN